MKVMFSQSCLSVILLIGGAPHVVNHMGIPPRTTWAPHPRMRSNLPPSEPSLFPQTCSNFSLGDPAPGLTSKRVVGLRLKDLLVQHRNTCFGDVVGAKPVHKFAGIESLDLKLSKGCQIDHTDSVIHHTHLPQYRVVPVGSPEGWFVSGIVTG